jgi:peroxiredoxin
MSSKFDSCSCRWRLRCVWLCGAAMTAFGIGGAHARANDPASDAAATTDGTQTAEPVQEEDRQEQAILAGHSLHGEVFNEGPRQAAYLMGGTGNVQFPCTSTHPEVQAFINQGVGQLHGFWYFEAERSFRQAAMLDPTCAIADWGMAMANHDNHGRAESFIKQAHEKKGTASRREQLYIDALHAFHTADTKERDGEKTRREQLIKAYESISFEFPEDLEAKAFLALELYEGRGKGIPIASYVAYDALMQEILKANPQHPCHHYRIHLWDYEKPERALDSAAACGPAVPTIAHMWHMPGHIYSRLHRYHDAVYQQEASARIDHRHMMHDRVLPDQIHNFAHNNEWLIRNMIYIGRAHDALDLARNMLDLPRHPKYNMADKGSSHFGRLRIWQVLEDCELWAETLVLAETRYLEAPEKAEDQWDRQRLIARAAAATGALDRVQTIRGELEQRRAEIEAERSTAVATAEADARKENKSDKDVEETVQKARDGFNGQLGKLGQILHALTLYEHIHHQRWAEAKTELEQAGSQPAALKALVQLRVGEVDPALETIKKEVDRSPQETIPLAHQVWLLNEAGKADDCRAAFERLRGLSSEIDLTVPLFARLQPIAESLSWPADWRTPRELPADIGGRPELASLGPFRWQPQAAMEWTLTDHEGKSFTLTQYRGKPVVVVFYLGYGCLHCAEQLQKLVPITEKYREAGIELIAISTDTPAQLLQSHENYKDGKFPFPLVSNDGLDVFRAWRCYDDFEQRPLHGCFLVDGAGLVRWQDISYEPFMDVDFILTEAQRLMSMDAVPPSQPAPATAGGVASETSDAAAAVPGA